VVIEPKLENEFLDMGYNNGNQAGTRCHLFLGKSSNCGIVNGRNDAKERDAPRLRLRGVCCISLERGEGPGKGEPGRAAGNPPKKSRGR
jgi:hypothetical protein